MPVFSDALAWSDPGVDTSGDWLRRAALWKRGDNNAMHYGADDLDDSKPLYSNAAINPDLLRAAQVAGGGVPDQRPGPGLSPDQLFAKGIKLPENSMSFDGRDMTSTTRSPMGTGYHAGDMLYSQTTRPSDPLALAQQMRAGRMAPLSSYMPAATKDYGELVKAMNHDDTLKAIESQKATLDDKRIRETDLRQEQRLDKAQYKSEEHEDFGTRQRAIEEFAKQYPDSTQSQRNKRGDEALAASRQSRQATKGTAGVPAKSVGVQAQTAGTSGPPVALTPGDLQADESQAMLAKSFPHGSLDVDALVNALHSRNIAEQLSPEAYKQVVADVAAKAGGYQPLMEKLGPQLMRSNGAQGRWMPFLRDKPAWQTPFGEITANPTVASDFNMSIDGQKFLGMPNRSMTGGTGVLPWGLFSLPSTIAEDTALNPTRANLLGAAIRNASMR